MSKTKSLKRRLFRYGLRFVLILLALFILQVTFLAFPQIVLHNSTQAGPIQLFYDGEPAPEIDRLAAEVDSRLQGSRFYEPSRHDLIFFFRDQSLYEFYTKLSLLPQVPQGYNLSILGNSYVCGPMVASLAERTGGQPKYSIWEGNPAHTMAHEIGHQYLIDSIGRGPWQELPHWKQEGLPEYIANYGTIAADDSATLRHRIGVLLNPQSWAATSGWYRQDWDRIHYEAGLLIEFLFEVQDRTLEEVIDPTLVKDRVYDDMMAWYRQQEI